MTCMDRAIRARTIAGVFISLAALQLTGVTATAAYADAAPKVVATEPAAGATVPAGPLKLKVTFDQKMMTNSYSFMVVPGGTFPPCQKTPTASADGMSFSLDCTLEAGKSYALGFNGASNMNFKNEAGVAAVPSELHFSAAP
jgi:methionine-rich copper-binding protein CopC